MFNYHWSWEDSGPVQVLPAQVLVRERAQLLVRVQLVGAPGQVRQQ
jgi:hypothetical protein